MNRADESSQELLELLELLREERASPEQIARIEAIVLADAAAMDVYVRYMAMTASLRHRLQGMPGLVESAVGFRRVEEARNPTRTRPARRRLMLAITTAIAAAVFFAVVLWPKPPVQVVPQIAATSSSPTAERIRLSQANGDVRIITGGASRPATSPAELGPGDTLKISGVGSSAALTYADGTRLLLVNDSSLTCLDGGRKSVVLHSGIVSAQVALQPAGAPMLLATPGTKVEVVGTQFAIAATTDRTDLNVSKGRVRLTRVSDGQTVEVAGGQGVTTDGEAKLVVRKTPAGDSWSADFESGAPKGWRGAYVTTGLPPGSRGAMKAVLVDYGDHSVFQVAAREEYIDGLFIVQNDLHLHITMKMERPNWLNVFFATHGVDGAPPEWALHIFNEVPFWQGQPGEWRTVTIPLAKFKRKRDGVFRDEPPIAGEVAYMMNVGSTEPDRGLVIDRVWITRGGPAVVESKPVP